RDRGKHPDLAPSVPRQPRPAQPPPRRRPRRPRPPRRRPPPAPPTRPLRTLLGGRPPRPRRRLPTRRGRPLLGQADQDRPARRAALPATPLLLFQRPLARTPPAVLRPRRVGAPRRQDAGRRLLPLAVRHRAADDVPGAAGRRARPGEILGLVHR